MSSESNNRIIPCCPGRKTQACVPHKLSQKK